MAISTVASVVELLWDLSKVEGLGCGCDYNPYIILI